MNEFSRFVEEVVAQQVTMPRDTVLRRPREIAERLGQALDAAIASGDAVSFYLLLDRLLDTDKTPLAVFVNFVRLWGGANTVRSRLLDFVSKNDSPLGDLIGMVSGHGSIAVRLEERLNYDQNDDGFDLADAAKLYWDNVAPAAAQIAKAAMAGPFGPAILAHGAYKGLEPHVNDILKTAKDYWHALEDRLADDGEPHELALATTMATLDDLFLPGKMDEALLTAIPMAKVGVLLKPILMRGVRVVGRRIAGTGLHDVAQVVMKYATKLIETNVGSLLTPFENALAARITSAPAGAASHKLWAEVAVFLQRMSRGVFSPKPVIKNLESAAAKEVSERVEKELVKHVDDLTAKFPTPIANPKVPITTSVFKALPDGKVIQTITGKFEKNTVGRAEKNLAGLGEKFDIFLKDGEHFGHLIASSKSGDDALYNLIITDGRINTSFMRIFDNIPAGKKVEVKVLFDTVEDAHTRIASHVEYHIIDELGEKKFVGGLGHLLEHPPQTLSQLRKEAMDLALRVGKEGNDDASLQLIQLLSNFFAPWLPK